MSLPWVRLDSNIATHDKILALVNEKDGHRAAAVYMFSLGYAGGHLTDGFIPKAALPVLHGTDKHARMLVDHRLWKYDPGGHGYRIHNWDERQEMATVAAAKRAAKRAAGRKGGCVSKHGPDCGCWKLELDTDD